jgi:hypothetical protein
VVADPAWSLRAHLSSDKPAQLRYREGAEHVACRMDTRVVSVLVRLTQAGELTLVLSQPGSLDYTTMLSGTVVKGDGGRAVFVPGGGG